MDSPIDLHSLFVPSCTLRVLRREAGSIGISDLVVVVLIADAAQNAMAAEYRSLTEGAILVATIALWITFRIGWASGCLPCGDCCARRPCR